MKSLTIPIPEPGVLESQDGPNSALVKWLGSLHEAMKPLAKLKLRNGGEVTVDLRSSEEGFTIISPEHPFQWGGAECVLHPDSVEDGLWVLGIEIDRTYGYDRELSELEESDYFHFYLDDFEGEGRVAKAKLALVLEIIMKRLAPPPTGFSNRLTDILTLLRS